MSIISAMFSAYEDLDPNVSVDVDMVGEIGDTTPGGGGGGGGAPGGGGGGGTAPSGGSSGGSSIS